MANQVDFKILPSDQFNVYSPQTRSDKIITYFTLLSKLRGDILAVGQEDDPNDIVSAYYSNVGGTQTLHLVKADGSEVTASYSTATSSENQNASTGILVGGELTASIGGTTFSISAGVGQIVSQTATPSGVSTIITPISWDAFTSITPTNLTTQPFTYIYIDSSGALQQQATPFNDAQYKNSIIIGHLCHIDLSTINLVTSDQNVAYGTPTRLLELIQTFGPIKKEGLTLSANGSNLQVNRSAGEGFIIGSNYQTDQFDPDKIVISAKTPSLLCRIYRDGSGGYVFDNNSGSYYNNIDPTKYDNGSGTLQTVNNNQWTIQRLYTFPSAPDDIICYYGTQIYNSQGDAIDNIPYEPFSEAPITALNSIFLGYLIPRGGASNLSSLGDATFIQAGLFRGLGSGGGSTTNLKLEDLSDVVITSPQNQDFLFYDSTSQEWQNVAVGIFKTIAVAGQSNVVADTYNDTLTFVAGTNVTITTDASTDSITINSTDQFVGTVTSVDMSVPTGFAISGNPITTSGTLALAFATGYSLPTDATQANWTAAYNDKINSASFDTSTGVITLTQQDAGTITVDIDGRFILLSEKGAANGVATLDAGGKLPVSQLPSSVFEYKGTWNAATNTPTLANGTGDPGDVYRCTVAGTVNFGAGAISFEIGDLVIYDGTEWQKSDSTDAVTSVNGYTGTVVLTTSDISEGTNLYFTTARARQSLSAGTAISYDNSTGVITNSAPDQIVAITAGTGTSVTGTYPNFTISATGTGGTVTSVDLTAGTGISVSGGPITTSGSITVTNTAPDQIVSLTGAGTTSVSGTYPNFTITSNDQYVGTVTSIATTAPITGGTITTTGTIGITQSGAASDGYLSSTDWNTFNSKEPALAKGNLTETTSSILTITGGTNAVIGSGTTIAVSQSSSTTSGYLSSTDWNTFNGKAGTSFTTISVSGQSNIVADSASDTLTIVSGTGVSITTDASTDTLTITNSAPDQVVSITGAGTTSVTGTYPSFTITSNDQYDGTVTSVDLTAGTGISVSGGPITTSGSITVTNTAPDQVVVLTASTGISTSGTYPNFTITNSAPDQVVSLTGAGTTSITGTYPNFTITSDDQYDGTVTSVDLTAGTGISVSGGPITSSGSITVTNTAPDQTVVLTAGTGITTSGTYPNFTVTNAAPDQTVALTAGTGISVTGTYPNFTITNSSPSSGGTVTSIATTAPITGGTITSTGTIGITQSGAAADGYLSFTDWNTFNGKQNAITLTTTGNSGAATFVSSTLNIPEYTLTGLGGVPTSRTLTINGTAFDLSANRSWSVGTVTSINLTAGDRIEVSGGPVTSSGSITVTHGVADGADFITAEAFRDRVIADGGIFEALGEVAIAIGSLDDAASPTSTDYSDGFVLQNLAIDEFGHVLGVSATDLDDRYLQSITAGTGISVSGSPSSTDGVVTITNSDTGSAQNIFKNIAVSGQSTIVADSNDDTLTVVAGTGISITTSAATDTLTITNTGTPSLALANSINYVPASSAFWYRVTGSYATIVMDTTNRARLAAPVSVSDVNRILATVTLEVANTGSAGFCTIGIQLYNNTDAVPVAKSLHTWTAYLDANLQDSSYTLFTLHFPIDDLDVDYGDDIDVQVISIASTQAIMAFRYSLVAVTAA